MYNNFSNIGYVSKKLSSTAIKKLNSYIKNKKQDAKYDLAGNISGSFFIEDKKDWFFNNELLPLIKEYAQNTPDFSLTPFVLTKDCKYKLDRFWVNFQKKYEFNPLHYHSGVFSFVIWIKIPASFKKEKNLTFVKNSKNPSTNTLSLVYVNSLGTISSRDYHLEPEDEGTILFFTSTMQHIVYPFYTSNKMRVSISGNISLDPNQIIQ